MFFYTFAQNFLQLSFARRNINAILVTVLVHLVIVFVCLFTKITIMQKDDGEYIIIDPSDFEMEDKQQVAEAEDNMMTDEEIAQYMQNLGHVGSNYSGSYKPTSSSQSSGMSEAEMKAMYEEAFLKEKYGDSYNDAMNKTYEDYIDQSRMEQRLQTTQSHNVVKKGPALVYAEPDNSAREASYLHVPVFTCEGSGTVVVRVSIASSGKVTAADVVSSNLSSDAECLTSAARSAALKSAFSKISGNKSEGGKITYTFVRQ